MNIGVVADKGGSGKTTVSLHLAYLLEEMYGNVVLIDQDPNRSAIKYEARRGLDPETGDGGFGFYVAGPEDEFPGGANHVVVDSQGRLERGELQDLAQSSDLIVIPSEPDSMSLSTIEEFLEDLARVGGAPHKVLLTKVPWFEARLYCPALAWLEDMEIPHFKQVIEERRVFKLASDDGLLLPESRRRKASAAWAEFQAVGQEIVETVRQLRAAGVR